jgi:hypothetical protein
MRPNNARSERDVWLELLAAVDYLSVTHRLGMTICHAIDEAIREWVEARREAVGMRSTTVNSYWHEPDSLRSMIEDLLTVVEPIGAPNGALLGDALIAAIDAWLVDAARSFNDGHAFTLVFER